MALALSSWFDENLTWIDEYAISAIVPGMIITLKLFVFSGLLGFPFAVLVGFARVSKRKWIFVSSSAFVSLIRGTPLLVQIFIYYRGLGSLFPSIPGIRHTVFWPYLADGFYYVVFALILSFGGYVGEVVRNALLSVPRGEIEAARAYGFRAFGLARRIWLPRAMQAMMPTLAGEAVLLLKSTALASQVAVLDLLGEINIIRSQAAITYTPLLVVAVGYLIATLAIEAVFRRLEAGFANTMRRVSA
jgi:polar amino acid transport system permease protein